LGGEEKMKLFKITMEFVVAANNKEKAVLIAGYRETTNHLSHADVKSVKEISEFYQVPQEWIASIPFGGDDDRTCREYFARTEA
jgi:hypothetical protein